MPTWRRGLDALTETRTTEPPSRYADILAAAGVRAPVSAPPQVNGVHAPIADRPADQHAAEEAELARRAAEFDRQSALEEPTPPQGTPSPFQRLLAVPPVSAPPIARLTPPSYAPVRPLIIPTSPQPVSGPPLAQHSAPPAPPGLRPTMPPEFASPLAMAGTDDDDPPLAAAAQGVDPQARPFSAPPAWAPVAPIPVSGPPHNRFGRSVVGNDPKDERALPEFTPQLAERLEPLKPVQPVQQPQVPRPPVFRVPDAPVDHVGDEQGVLPQRVPAKPDVPPVPDDPVVAAPVPEPPAARDPELSRIASGLRRDEPPPLDRPDGFDVAAVLAAVRKVPGVRDAHLRAAPSGAHTLRLDLSDGADPGYVSRLVARMLAEKMGLSAEPPNPPEQPRQQQRQDEQLRSDEPTPEPPPAAAPVVKPTPTPPTQRGAATVPPGLIPHPPTGDGHDPWSTPPREPRRRHPVTVRGRVPSELRASSTSESSEEFNSEPTSPPLIPAQEQAPRVVLDNVRVSTFGLEATVEVRLVSGSREAVGVARGPSVDAYVLRLCAVAAATAVDNLLTGADSAEPGVERGRCFVEHATLVPMGSCDVAVVVVLLVCGGWVEQLAGSALVSGDPRQAVVRATLAAVNRRLTALLP